MPIKLAYARSKPKTPTQPQPPTPDPCPEYAGAGTTPVDSELTRIPLFTTLTRPRPQQEASSQSAMGRRALVLLALAAAGAGQAGAVVRVPLKVSPSISGERHGGQGLWTGREAGRLADSLVCLVGWGRGRLVLSLRSKRAAASSPGRTTYGPPTPPTHPLKPTYSSTHSTAAGGHGRVQAHRGAAADPRRQAAAGGRRGCHGAGGEGG